LPARRSRSKSVDGLRGATSGDLGQAEAQDQAQAPLQERVATAITRFAGSMWFASLHAAVFGFWIVANLAWLPLVRQWDTALVMLGNDRFCGGNIRDNLRPDFSKPSGG
jgi:uncharacterized membrane protein